MHVSAAPCEEAYAGEIRGEEGHIFKYVIYSLAMGGLIDPSCPYNHGGEGNSRGSTRAPFWRFWEILQARMQYNNTKLCLGCTCYLCLQPSTLGHTLLVVKTIITIINSSRAPRLVMSPTRFTNCHSQRQRMTVTKTETIYIHIIMVNTTQLHVRRRACARARVLNLSH